MRYSLTARPPRHCRGARRSRLRAVAGVALLALVAAGCGGPKAPLNIGAKPVTLDVLIGTKKAVARAPVPPVAFPAGPTGVPLFDFDFGGIPPRRIPPPRVPPLCLDANVVPPEGPPFALLPPPGKYTYSAKGSFKVGGANAAEQPFPSSAAVEVLEPRITTDAASMTFHWKTAVTIGGVRTTTAYRSTIPLLAAALSDKVPSSVTDGMFSEGVVYPKPPDERTVWPGGDPVFGGRPETRDVIVPPYPAPGAADVAQPTRGVHFGLYIESVETKPLEEAAGSVTANETLALFTPSAPGLLLAKYPFEVGSAFDVTGGDAETTMSYRATVRPKATVRTCHFVLDTWTIELTRGRIVDVESGEAVDFTGRYQIATGFGGLFAQDHVEVSGYKTGTEGVVPVVRNLEMTLEGIG